MLPCTCVKVKADSLNRKKNIQPVVKTVDGRKQLFDLTNNFQLLTFIAFNQVDFCQAVFCSLHVLLPVILTCSGRILRFLMYYNIIWYRTTFLRNFVYFYSFIQTFYNNKFGDTVIMNHSVEPSQPYSVWLTVNSSHSTRQSSQLTNLNVRIFELFWQEFMTCAYYL